MELSLAFGKICTCTFPLRLSRKHNAIRKIALCLRRQMSSTSENDVIIESVNDKGVITLNRPKALNALNLSMIRKIFPTMKNWEKEKSLVIMKGTGEKAFCAGGDVRAVTEAGIKGTNLGRDFFREEYTLNSLIGTYHIPYVAFIDGITMGGGVGLSVHGHFRVATERTLFAMPETAIGLFPDVGGSYFLPRLGGKLGLYLALTGYRLKGLDVLKAGIATHFCDSGKLVDLLDSLLKCPGTQNAVEEVLNKFSKSSTSKTSEFSLTPYMSIIDSCFSAPTVEEILERLRAEGSEWSLKTIETLNNMSPTSLKVTKKQLEEGEGKSLLDCLKMEYRLAVHACEGHDFYEGVKALLIDKGRKPNWKPSTLSEVTDEFVDAQFAPLSSGEELKL
ncbi:3-hydroxyisobutyryl-CoA hydrolase, mitochondrial isoform X1 [Schistocerca serialis cubense]|uniref:3-hydroxyisobutyryl-CoA hydrolase, mitochondrial isoform X1 n=1 Tax=Schistocerca serialis cubense TaxID=2023355 RepID=UPI00214E7132|nr:3-hydroxyisobutyryl-CoA hydrolase, mitochondrial isoform X1 [Schistocerca serialis cubense]